MENNKKSKLLSFITALALFLCTSCKDNTLYDNTSSYYDDINNFVQTVTVTEEAFYTYESASESEIEETYLIPSTDEISEESFVEETADIYFTYGKVPLIDRWWYDIIDLETADYINTVNYRGSTVKHATWYNTSIMRYSLGTFIQESEYDRFTESLNAVNNADINDILNNSDYIVLSEKEEYNGLSMEKACFTLEHLYSFNRASVMFNGNVVLKGIAKIEKETDLMEIIKQGDVFFYPYPESIADYPLLFPPYAYTYSKIIDHENNFYMYADTPQLYLGNAFTGEVYTRMREVRLEEPGWLTNEELAAFVADEIDEGTYYEIEIEVSNIILNQYEEVMSGYPFSAANVQKVISIKKIK